MSIRSYRDLIVWQKSMDLATAVHRRTRSLPAMERFGLGAQLSRAAVSIPSNIAEGHERDSRADYRRHVSIARSSTAELETQLELAARLGYLGLEETRVLMTLAGEVGRMLTSLRGRLRPASP
jgi:four helix bundle protein